MTTRPEGPRVLFVCVHNAGRSQMAAAFVHAMSSGAIEVGSAGSDPADRLNPVVVEAMREAGIDLAGEHPTRLTNDAVQASDVVVTMGCGDACPVFPGTRYEDWAGADRDTVRAIRDDIRARTRRLVAELLPS